MRTPRTARQRAIGKALTALLPMAPYADIEKIRELALQAKLRDLPPSIAVWLAAISHIRHEHTEYDELLSEGYGREAARHFTLDEINRRLATWRATRYLEEDEDPGDLP
jgi:hypothetical protein